MKRLHMHVFVSNIEKARDFYTTLFRHEPTLHKADYVRWELDEPALNFAISDKGSPGIDHLGIQVADVHQLSLLTSGVAQPADESNCCYAHSVKSWVQDPDGLDWELFTSDHNLEQFYGQATTSSCCSTSSCC